MYLWLNRTGSGFTADGSDPFTRQLFNESLDADGNGRNLWYGVGTGLGYGDGRGYGNAGNSDHDKIYPFELILYCNYEEKV